MAIFNSYVSLPEGKLMVISWEYHGTFHWIMVMSLEYHGDIMVGHKWLNLSININMSRRKSGFNEC
jgi:hypothetical protein